MGIDMAPTLCREASRTNSIRPRTRNFASSEETWNFTVRSERFRWAAISLLARLFIRPERTSSSRRVIFTWLPTDFPASNSLSAFDLKVGHSSTCFMEKENIAGKSRAGICQLLRMFTSADHLHVHPLRMQPRDGTEAY